MFLCGQVYIRNCGSHRIELGHQVFVMKRLEHVAEQVKLGDSKESRKKILQDRSAICMYVCMYVSVYVSVYVCMKAYILRVRLTEIVLPTTFKLPLNPHLKVCMYVFMYVCMFLCMYVCMHACMYVCMNTFQFLRPTLTLT